MLFGQELPPPPYRRVWGEEKGRGTSDTAAPAARVPRARRSSDERDVTTVALAADGHDVVSHRRVIGASPTRHRRGVDARHR